MKIYFQRSGGFAGIKLTKEIDSDLIPVDDARKLQEMVDGCDFFNLAGRIMNRLPDVDRFHYIVKIETNEKTHTVETTDSAAPAELQMLLDYLTKIARKR